MKYLVSLLAVATFALSLGSTSFAQDGSSSDDEDKQKVKSTTIFNDHGCFSDECDSEGDWCILIIFEDGSVECRD